MDYKVSFYENIDNKVRCKVCPHNCLINEGNFGVCRVRSVKHGKLFATNYGEVTSAAVDPIEKKPLYHYKPSKNILSIGSFGCNMTCSFCQNYEISQNRPATEFLEIDRLISIIEDVNNNAGIAFTYNEPMMWYEYMFNAAKKIKEHNEEIGVVVVTNGYINKEPLNELLPYIDAMNIDLKGYTNRYYNKICGANLEPVLESIKRCNDNCHVEITTLLVSDENDSLEEIRNIAEFISSINENIPLHLSRYFPRYKMENKATRIDRIIEARDEAKKYLRYVYVGNVGGIYNNTYCTNCGEVIIKRNGYNTEVHLHDGKCDFCGRKTNIIQ